MSRTASVHPIGLIVIPPELAPSLSGDLAERTRRRRKVFVAEVSDIHHPAVEEIAGDRVTEKTESRGSKRSGYVKCSGLPRGPAKIPWGDQKGIGTFILRTATGCGRSFVVALLALGGPPSEDPDFRGPRATCDVETPTSWRSGSP
jgi:hypothetical protein